MSGKPGLTYAPRLLGAPQAAAYLGISATNLRGLGLPVVLLGTRRLYDRIDLDAYADNLPRDGGENAGSGAGREVNTCDGVWGTA